MPQPWNNLKLVKQQDPNLKCTNVKYNAFVFNLFSFVNEKSIAGMFASKKGQLIFFNNFRIPFKARHLHLRGQRKNIVLFFTCCNSVSTQQHTDVFKFLYCAVKCLSSNPDAIITIDR